MNGQMSLFDFIQEPDGTEQIGEEMARGYLEGIEALKPAPKDARRKTAEERRQEAAGKVKREPCGRFCPVECYSKECFIRRGYIWQPAGQRGNWLRDEENRIIIGPKMCDWVPVDGPLIDASFECFAEYRSEAGGVRFGKCEKGREPGPEMNCKDCPVHQEFYRIADEYQRKGKPWGEAIALTVEKLKISTVPEYTPDAYQHGTTYDQERQEWIPKNWRQK